MAEYRARDIAEWFLAWADDIEADISNLKLQKLLYYAQGHFLARTGAPLFDDAVQAWAHGPVVPDVYHAFKDYGRGPIDADRAVGAEFDWDRFKPVESFLNGHMGPIREPRRLDAAGEDPSRAPVARCV